MTRPINRFAVTDADMAGAFGGFLASLYLTLTTSADVKAKRQQEKIDYF